MSKPIEPGVTRANTVLAWQVGQSGRRKMIMMLSPLVQAGALQDSQSPVDTEGAVMGPCGTFAIPPLVNFAHFRKVNVLVEAKSIRRPPAQRPCYRNNAVWKNLANWRLPMPRYFFDVTDGHRLFDESGFVCEGDTDQIIG